MKTKKKGFSLIELIVVITIAIPIIVMIMHYMVEERKKVETLNFVSDAQSVVKAVDQRLDIDGFNSSYWSKTEWLNEEDIVDNLIKKELTSVHLKDCEGGGWNPTVDQYKESRIIECDLWKNRQRINEDLRAELLIDNVGFVSGFNLYIQFKNIEKVSPMNVKYALNKIKWDKGEEQSGIYNYNFYSSDSHSPIGSVECFIDLLNCEIKIYYDRAGGAEYVRVDGLNSMIDSHLTFIESRNESPLKCIRWDKAESSGETVWSRVTDEECGVGIYKNSLKPMVVEIKADNGTFNQVLLDEECINYKWNGETVVDSGKRTPCGFLNNGSTIYQVVENLSTGLAYIENLYGDNGVFEDIYVKTLTAETLTADFINAKKMLKADLIESYTANGKIEVNSEMSIKEIFYAEKDSYVYGNSYIGGDNIVTGNITSNLDIIANNSIVSNEELKLLKINSEDGYCSNNGALSRTSDGKLLSCVSNKWTINTNNAPIGTIAMWAGSKPPTNWIEMNGQSTYSYPKLRAIVGNNVPDLRGMFVRGWDNRRGVDSGRGLKSYQGDAMRNITARTRFGIDKNASSSVGVLSNSGVFYGSGGVDAHVGDSGGGYGGSGASYQIKHRDNYLNFDASRQVPTANEIRPKNTALMYIIKAK